MTGTVSKLYIVGMDRNNIFEIFQMRHFFNFNELFFFKSFRYKGKITSNGYAVGEYCMV